MLLEIENVKSVQKETLENLSRVEKKIELLDDALLRNTLLTVYIDDIKNLVHVRRTFMALEKNDLGDIITDNSSYQYPEFLEVEKRLPQSIDAVFKMLKNGIFDGQSLWERDRSKNLFHFIYSLEFASIRSNDQKIIF